MKKEGEDEAKKMTTSYVSNQIEKFGLIIRHARQKTHGSMRHCETNTNR